MSIKCKKHFLKKDKLSIALNNFALKLRPGISPLGPRFTAEILRTKYHNYLIDRKLIHLMPLNSLNLDQLSLKLSEFPPKEICGISFMINQFKLNLLE